VRSSDPRIPKEVRGSHVLSSTLECPQVAYSFESAYIRATLTDSDGERAVSS